MGQTLETLTVKLEADAGTYAKALDDAEKKTSSFASRMGGSLQSIGKTLTTGLAVGAGVAAAAVGAFAVSSIGAASDLGETISKTNVLFGDSADTILEWSQETATAMGQSQQQALDAAATFATFGKSAGLTGKDLTSFSTNFTQLAGDLASFNNTTPQQAIDAIGAALRGESEPLRAYGVLLDDASMRNEALKLGLISTTKDALTPQQKVLAAQSLIYQQTGAAQGDFARTSGGLANQQRILGATFENIKTTLGTALLPIVTAVVTKFNEWLGPLVSVATNIVAVINQVSGMVQAATDLTGVLDALQFGFEGVLMMFGMTGEQAKALGDSVRGVVDTIIAVASQVVDAIKPVIGPIVDFIAQWISWKDVAIAAGIAIAAVVIPAIASIVVAAAPVIATVAAVIAVVALLRNAWETDWGGIQEKTQAVVGVLKNIFQSIVGFITNAVDVIKGIFGALRKTIESDGVGPFAYLKDWAAQNLPRIQQLVETVFGAIKTVITTVMGFVRGVFEGEGGAISEIWQNTWDSIKTIVDTGFETILGLVTLSLQLLTGDWEGAGETLKGIVTRIWDAIKTIFNNSIENIKTIFTSFDWAGIGEDILGGIEDGIARAAVWLLDTVESIGQRVLDALKWVLGISSPSKEAAAQVGVPVAQGIGEGLSKGLRGVGVQLQGAMDSLLGDVNLSPSFQAAGGGSAPMTLNVYVSGNATYDTGRQVGRGVLDELRAAGVR